MEISKKIQIEKVTPNDVKQVEDEIVVEVSVRNHYGDLCVDLPATPADLDELAAGYAVTQGIVSDFRCIGRITKISELERSVELKTEIPQTEIKKNPSGKAQADPKKLLAWAERVFQQSSLSEATGGVHIAAIFIEEKEYCRFEDIGRHNAVDKAVGYAVLRGQSLDGAVTFVSGRVSADYLKKMLRAGIKTVVSPCAVTSKAVEVARDAGVELWGFARNGRMNRYC